MPSVYRFLNPESEIQNPKSNFHTFPTSHLLLSVICLLPSALCPLLFHSDFRIPTSEFKDHLRNGQLNLPGQTGCLLKLIFKPGYLAIKLGAIKSVIGFIRTPFVKGAASRPMDDRLSGLLKLVGDTVQPADHGAVVVQDAQAIII